VDRTELASYLRQSRARLSPADVGLAARQRRRTPGLRRQEVAQLVGMSVDYYVRLEQGRGPNPSDQMLTALARALRLTDDGRDHLFNLAGVAPPRSTLDVEHVRPAVLHVLDRLDDTPAHVSNDRYDVLAWNELYAAMSGDLSGVPARDRNLAWRFFTNDEVRARFDPEELPRLAATHVADLRASAAARPDDVGLHALLGRLRAASAEFRELWARHDVSVRRTDHKVLIHPLVGRLELNCEILLMPDHGQRLIIHTPRGGTPTKERLELLRVIGMQEFAGSTSVSPASVPRS
jgi:transcriptional regulator with XRE-family HTH domain